MIDTGHGGISVVNIAPSSLYATNSTVCSIMTKCPRVNMYCVCKNKTIEVAWTIRRWSLWCFIIYGVWVDNRHKRDQCFKLNFPMVTSNNGGFNILYTTLGSHMGMFPGYDPISMLTSSSSNLCQSTVPKPQLSIFVPKAPKYPRKKNLKSSPEYSTKAQNRLKNSIKHSLMYSPK